MTKCVRMDKSVHVMSILQLRIISHCEQSNIRLLILSLHHLYINNVAYYILSRLVLEIITRQAFIHNHLFIYFPTKASPNTHLNIFYLSLRRIFLTTNREVSFSTITKF